MKKFLIVLILLVSCTAKKEKGQLTFRDFGKEKREEQERKDNQRREFERKLRLKKEKIISWNKIVNIAKTEFRAIEPIIKRKCYDCHNVNKKLPLYGRIFKKYNPVYKHRKEGLVAIDFANKFPLTALGSPSQLSLLRSIRNVTLDRTMPIGSYTFFYPSRKIKFKDELRILRWVEPLIEAIEEHNRIYAEVDNDGTLDSLVKNVFEQRCNRCHANGQARGGFSNMQNLEELLLDKRYVDLDNPESSEIYKLSETGEMPPSSRERLSEDEVNIILDWLKAKSAERGPTN